MAEKKRTLWPIGILLIIVLGIILIVITIVISSKQSIDTDLTFDMNRLRVNGSINTIMKQQNMFEKHYNVRISTIGDKSSNAPLMKNPYYISPVPRNIPEGDGLLQAGDDITFYIEKKDDSTEPNIFKDPVLIPDRLKFVRLDQGEKKTDLIYAQLYNGGHDIYTTKYLVLPKQGYYQVRLTILVAQPIDPNVKIQNNQIDADNTEIIRNYKSYPDKFSFHEVYFYYWIFNNTQNHIQVQQ